MRIAIATLNYAPEPTGIAPYSAGLARGLVQRGHEVRVLTTFPHYPRWRHDGKVPWSAREHVDGVEVVRLKHFVPRRPRGAMRAASEISFGLRSVANGVGDVDVVVVISPALFASAMVARRMRTSRRGGPPVGVVVQDLYGLGVRQAGQVTGPLGRLVAKVEGRTLRSADGVSVIHERFSEVVQQEYGVPSERIVVNRNWTHVDSPLDVDVRVERARRGWSDDEVVVLHTGAMGDKQGLENVVAAARVAHAASSRVRFVLVGDGGRRRHLQAAALDTPTIEFHDPWESEDFLGALRCADVLLVNESPGVVEMAVPSKLTSYFSSGRPVVAATDSRSTTAHEVAASGAGVRVDPGDPHALLRAVLELGAHPERAAAMGSRGPLYSSEVLDSAQILDGYEHWLKSLVG